MNLVSDWRKAYKWWSLHVTVIITVLSFLYDYTRTIHDVLPVGWTKYALILIIVARMLRQEIPTDASPDPKSN
jgi:hypothetical protein